MVFMVLVNWPQSVLCVCEFVCYQIRIPVKKNHMVIQILINLMSCSIKHTPNVLLVLM